MWQPIETAPRDGTAILAYSEPGCTGVMMVRWIALQEFVSEMDAADYASAGMSERYLEEPDWFVADFCQGDRLSEDCYPTHWMPLPTVPETV